MAAKEAVLQAEPAAADRAWPFGPVWAAVLLIRLVHIDQPIVENYVGRQVPTAMVARNLERGSGLLRPQLDTAPFPNYFLVEPPLYECGVVALRWATGLTLEQAGRALSALSTAVAAWGLFELTRRRGGRRAAWLAVSAFAVFPLTIRYGRAVQPDAAMLGAVLAGLACWDRFQSDRRGCWIAAGWSLLALGLAIKILAAFVLIPLVWVILRRRRAPEIVAVLSTLLPSLSWYIWADHLAAGSGGSRAAIDNRTIWWGLLGSPALARRETWELVFRFLFLRGLTPLGAVLAVLGLVAGGNGEVQGRRFWQVWMVAGLAMLAILARKLHHEYYFLILAPAAAAGVGRALDRLAAGRGTRALAAAVGLVLVLLCGLQARSTWRNPPEWKGLAVASQIVATAIPGDAWVVAPEALLFQADRRGCRLEWTTPAVRRAAGEWGVAAEVHDASDLVEFYRRQGARYFADLGAGAADPRRMALHDAVRRRYKVMVNRREVFIADLVITTVPGPWTP